MSGLLSVSKRFACVSMYYILFTLTWCFHVLTQATLSPKNYSSHMMASLDLLYNEVIIYLLLIVNLSNYIFHFNTWMNTFRYPI